MPTQPPRPKAVNDPHDTYVKKVFGELAQARAFFRAYLPEDVQALFDWRTLRLESVSFISDELQRRFADLRFTIRLIGDAVDRHIHLLFDHKHRVIYTTPRQLHRYIGQIMDETPDNQPLPSILTVVLLQSGTWNRTPTLSSEYDLPDAARQVLAPYLVDFRLVLVELVRLEESDLKGTVSGRLALALLKAVGEGKPTGWLRFRTLLSDVCGKLRPDRLHRELRRALYYLLSVTDEEQEAEVRQSLQTLQNEFLPVKEHFMTLLEHLEKRGEKRGKELGEKLGEKRGEKRGTEIGQHLGRVVTLTRQLSAAFPEFTSAEAERLKKLPDKALDEVADAIVQRRTWADIRKLLRRNGA